MNAYSRIWLLVIEAVGVAARIRLDVETPWEYVGCRRDLITTSMSAIAYEMAFGGSS